ncbi:2Fe-2S iron-sulfur cluster-binding protein [Gayadomonas joobiniege]|uniref:2Fe-2S iron-sulfur cluster-binding protein n=1 Tax=Gayadomonas joobiniege TaxID=1234606 RepID=UPI0003689FFD|nr:2Fe-2S iron-sulfur cluster-binding protein [Gayadomonas joobiniege]
MNNVQIEIVPDGVRFEAEPLETIVDAAIRNKVNLPYECLYGSCRRCICKLEAGRVSYGDSAYIFTDEEIAQQLVIACIAYPLTDLKISLLNQD